MKKIILTCAILVTGLSVAACGASGVTSNSPTASPDQSYLNALLSQPDFANMKSSDLIGLGKAACGDFNIGYGPAQVAQDGINAVDANPGLGITYQDIGFLIGDAVANYCPQYTAETQSWANSQ